MIRNQPHSNSIPDQKARRNALWNEIVSRGETGMGINRRHMRNTKDPDVAWILKNKPVLIVRDGPRRSRTTAIVAR